MQLNRLFRVASGLILVWAFAIWGMEHFQFIVGIKVVVNIVFLVTIFEAEMATRRTLE